MAHEGTSAPSTRQHSSPESESSSAKKPYVPPKLNYWGTLQEITQSAGWQGASDGGRGFYRRTRW